MKKLNYSIIIPAFNEEKLISLCLQSIKEIDYPKDKMEIIVVDNGSIDNTRKIAKSFGAQILKDDIKNVSGLRNLGANISRGDILAFIDADCVVSKDWLKKAEIYNYRKDVAAWGSPPVPPNEATWVQDTWYIVRQKENMIQNVDWLESMNLFVKKDLFLLINGFNEKLVTCEDVDLSYRIRKYGEIISDNRIIVYHLGEARNIKEFIRKEIWRGQSNLQSVRGHRVTLKEIPSLLIPIYFGILIPILLVINLIWYQAGILLLTIGIYFIPSIIVLYKNRKKMPRFLMWAQLLLILQAYFISRTLAILKLNK